MQINNGERKEEVIAKQINGKKVGELPPYTRLVIDEIFEKPNSNAIVESVLLDEAIKPDISITINGVTHYISIKTGTNNIIHQEYIKNFCLFLRDNGISNRTLKTILLFQYGDGTLDGSAKERLSYNELRTMLDKEIFEANIELNKDKNFVLKCIERFLFKGSNEDNIEADYLYHGDVDFGQVVSKKQVMKHIDYRNWDFYEALHIGPVLFRPHARYYKKEIKHESYRRRVEFYWPNLQSDIIYIRRHYSK